VIVNLRLQGENPLNMNEGDPRAASKDVLEDFKLG
jgi:hypothetical protein